MISGRGGPITLEDADPLSYVRSITVALNYEFIRDRNPSERRQLLLAQDIKSLYAILRGWGI